jgi:hypothetical protein
VLIRPNGCEGHWYTLQVPNNRTEGNSHCRLHLIGNLHLHEEGHKGRETEMVVANHKHDDANL